jgi:hypothetical protein
MAGLSAPKIKTPHLASFVGHPLFRGEGLGVRGHFRPSRAAQSEMTYSIVLRANHHVAL